MSSNEENTPMECTCESMNAVTELDLAFWSHLVISFCAPGELARGFAMIVCAVILVVQIYCRWFR